MITCVLWDWNGTLLNDAQYACGVVNAVLKKHELPLLKDVEAYREVFCFPVSLFYEHVGLGGALYDQAAHEWVAEYYAHEADCTLREGAMDVLRRIACLGARQAIISATPREALKRQVGRYRGLPQCFEKLLGLDDIHARSKVRLAQEFMRDEKTDPARTLFVGDSLHDAEVARAIGCRCVLLLGGHQTETMIRGAGCPVLEDIRDLPAYIERL
jgi:phosphoglycolate phosphatase